MQDSRVTMEILEYLVCKGLQAIQAVQERGVRQALLDGQELKAFLEVLA